MSRFNYLIDKVCDASFVDDPFKHIYVEDFFHKEDFNDIVGSQEILIKPCASDSELFDELFKSNYKVIRFPGCVTDYKKYISLHSKGKPLKTHTACESSGVVLRLSPTDDILIQLDEFLMSESFGRAIAQKFDIPFEKCIFDGGIQKYLDGYEISPHPDVRRKAMTFMVNINPHPDSDSFDHHTRYLKLTQDVFLRGEVLA